MTGRTWEWMKRHTWTLCYIAVMTTLLFIVQVVDLIWD